MARNERKNNKVIIVIILFFAIISILAYFIYENIEHYKNNQNEIIKLTTTLNEKIEEKNTSNTENNELLEKINHLKNIEKETTELKEEVFNLAKNLEQDIINKKSTKKIAYLTFDDGPYYLTHKFLDVLEQYNVKATFFTIGSDKKKCYDNRSKECYPLYKKIVDSGHTIANHTYSHAIWGSLYKSTNNFINQVKKQENLIKEQTGVTTNILRFPGGSSTAGKLKNSIINELRKNNYGWVDWTSQNGDGGSISSKEQALKTFKNSINENIEVVLFHDYNNITLSMLPDAIKHLENKGYILLPLFYESVMINK